MPDQIEGPKWRRIGPDDWSCTNIGRIYRHRHGPRKDHWAWFMQSIEGDRTNHDCEGTSASFSDARAAVKRSYQELLRRPLRHAR